MNEEQAKLITDVDTKKLLEERQKAREIIHEIIKFGVTEQQKLLIIKFIGEHIEDYKLMQLVTWFADEILNLNNNVAETKLAALRDAAITKIGLISYNA